MGSLSGLQRDLRRGSGRCRILCESLQAGVGDLDLTVNGLLVELADDAVDFGGFLHRLPSADGDGAYEATGGSLFDVGRSVEELVSCDCVHGL